MASQSGDNPLEDLAKFGYNLNMKLHFKEHHSIFFGYTLEPGIEIC
jgi:hypothetical protein